MVQQNYLVPIGILLVEGKKGECDVWIFRTCLEEGPVQRISIGKLNCKLIKMHWTNSDDESH